MVARRAAYIAFPQAVPKKAVIERAGTSPCTYNCPAGIKAHGYVSLVRSGEYEKAFDLVLETTPLVGSLGRACYAPCEEQCTRGSLEGPLPIRRIKRFVADTHYAAGGEPRSPGGRAERQARRGRRLRARRPHRRLAATAAGLRRDHLRGRARAGRHAPPVHSQLPPARGGRRARRGERHGDRRRDPHEHEGGEHRRAEAAGLRRRPPRDRHARVDAPRRSRRGARRGHLGARLPARGQARRARRPRRQARGRDRRRQRRHRRRPQRAPARRRLRADGLPRVARGDARTRVRGARRRSPRASSCSPPGASRSCAAAPQSPECS